MIKCHPKRCLGVPKTFDLWGCIMAYQALAHVTKTGAATRNLEFGS